MTSEERREVARKLRRFAANDEIGYSSDIAVYLALCDVFGDIEPGDDAKVERLLADFIEPDGRTCRNISDDHFTNFKCSECGCFWPNFFLEGHNYCPHCGARIEGVER